MSTSDLKRKSGDVGWDYAEIGSETNRDKVKCSLCNKIMHGGITRLKQHIAGVQGQVRACRKASDLDKAKCLEALANTKKKKIEVKEKMQEVRDEVSLLDEEREDVELEGSSRKEPHKLGPIDQFVRSIEMSSMSSKELKQKKLNDALFKKRTQDVDAYVARWIYASGVAFNSINNDEWKQMVEAIGQFGPGYEPPSQHRLREPLLKQEVEKMRLSLKKYEDEWKKSGCSIMTDAWSDRKRRSIMNICVNCKLGTVFLSSKEDSIEEHTGKHIFEYVDKYIEKIGEEVVVQVVTDNATNNMAAAKLLKAKRPGIFWTSCATHTLNLILEGIGNLPKFKSTIQKAKALTIFIYAHHKTLALMRRYCKNREIVRPGATRFASAFLTLQSLLSKRKKLMNMFFSSEWTNCKFSKTSKGKKAQATVFSAAFWENVELCVQIFDPLVRVLRLVDGDVRPSMGFVVGYLNEAKKKIMGVCGEGPLTKSIFDIIHSKSKDRLDTPLHLTSYMLNPIYFFRDETIENMCMEAFLHCVEVFFPEEIEIQSDIINIEFLTYKEKRGLFGKTHAINGWEKYTDAEFDPVTWWTIFGSHAPNLKKLAVRILTLTSSSSGCERNWSTFEGIHTKKRNRLDAARLNDLVYVQFNSKLQNKKARTSRKKNPLVANDDSMAQGWKVKGGDENDHELSSYMGISCKVISEAMEADDVLESRSSARNKGKGVMIDEEDEEDGSNDDEEEEEEDEEENDEPIASESNSSEDEDEDDY